MLATGTWKPAWKKGPLAPSRVRGCNSLEQDELLQAVNLEAGCLTLEGVRGARPLLRVFLVKCGANTIRPLGAQLALSSLLLQVQLIILNATLMHKATAQRSSQGTTCFWEFPEVPAGPAVGVGG